MLAPAIDDVAPRVRKRVRDEHAELFRPRLVAIYAGVLQPDGTVRCLHLRVQERALLKKQAATRTPGERMNRVVAVFRAEAVEHDPPLVRLAVAVRVLQEHQVRLLGYVDAAVAELEPGRKVQAVGKDRSTCRRGRPGSCLRARRACRPVSGQAPGADRSVPRGPRDVRGRRTSSREDSRARGTAARTRTG